MERNKPFAVKVITPLRPASQLSSATTPELCIHLESYMKHIATEAFPNCFNNIKVFI